jgi:hypothetical protein
MIWTPGASGFFSKIRDDRPKPGQNMKTLLTATAATEAGAGLALLACPSAVVTLLLGSGLNTAAAVALGRMAGAALLSLGVACWLARGDEHSRAALGLVTAMALYNFGVVVLLGYAGIRSGAAGIALWPAVGLHTAMTFWCIMCLGTRRLKASNETQP